MRSARGGLGVLALSAAVVGLGLMLARCDCAGNVTGGPGADGGGDRGCMVANPCRTCDPSCTATTFGFDPAAPPNYGFDPADENGVAPDPAQGGLVLSTQTISAGYVWPANNDDSSVSKIDMDTGEEVGRYYVGLDGIDNMSSRTAIDGRGACYVGNRAFSAQGSVTKIAGIEQDCVDRNGNGVIDTSRGTTPLPRGQDECVLWTVPLGGIDARPRALAIDAGDESHPEGYPWVGLYNEMSFYQLNPADGSIVNMVNVGAHPYGAAIDRLGNLWISGRTTMAIQSVNVVSLALGAVIPMPAGCSDPYGIAVDAMNRVWIACWPPSAAARYNPADGTWLVLPMPIGSGARGVAIDASNGVWVTTNSADGLVNFSAADGTGMRTFTLRAGTPIGVGLDSMGRVWTVNQGTVNTSRIDPVTGAETNFPPAGLPSAPYTYSDFTGFARRTFTAPSGSWSHTFMNCPQPSAVWGDLYFDVVVPTGTHVVIEGRTAATAAGTVAATAVTLARIPSDTSPVDVGAAFTAAGVMTGQFLNVTITLYSDNPGASPVLRSVSIEAYCGPVLR